MSTTITGGETVRKTLPLSDTDMQEVQRLLRRGPHITEADVRTTDPRVKAKVDAYEDYMDRIKSIMSSSNPRVQAELALANKGFTDLRTKDIAPATVHQNATLASMSVQYANEAFIGEPLCPEVRAARQTGTYYIYGQSDRMQYPDDELGPRSRANEIQESRSTDTYACVPYGYENFVSAMTLANQDAPLDEMIDLQEAILEGLLYRRELRIATLLTTAGNYGANTAAIAAGNAWNTATGGDPIGDIQNATAEVWQGRGPSDLNFFSSLAVYNVLSRHPAILDLFKYNGSSPGLATPDMIARWFDASRYLIGKARSDATNEATAATFTRVWSDVFGMVRVARRASIRNAAFAYTFRHGAPISLQWFDEKVGHGGGYSAKVSVSEQHKVVAAPTGYLITAPTP